MKVSVVRETENGPEQIIINLSENEASFFVEYAINDLLSRGLQTVSVLEHIKKEHMHQA